MDINKILERIQDVYEAHDGGRIYLEEKETVKLINILADVANSFTDIQPVSGSFCKGDYLKNGTCTKYEGDCTKGNCDYWK